MVGEEATLGVQPGIGGSDLRRQFTEDDFEERVTGIIQNLVRTIVNSYDRRGTTSIPLEKQINLVNKLPEEITPLVIGLYNDLWRWRHERPLFWGRKR